MIDSLRAWCGYQMPAIGTPGFRAFRRFGPKRLETRLFPRVRAKLDAGDLTQFTTWWQGRRFERPTCSILESWLSEATVFFDIGSNYGFFTWLALSTAPYLRCHAFEPHERTFALLRSIGERNGFSHRFSSWHMGMGDREERLALHPGKEDSGHTTFGNHPELPKNDDLAVSVRRFGDWRREAGLPMPPRAEWVAKIDVEGYEARVLRGMEEELRGRVFRGLVVEINPYTLKFCHSSPEEIFSFMEKVGYRPLTPENHPLMRGAKCGNAFFVPA